MKHWNIKSLFIETFVLVSATHSFKNRYINKKAPLLQFKNTFILLCFPENKTYPEDKPYLFAKTLGEVRRGKGGAAPVAPHLLTMPQGYCSCRHRKAHRAAVAAASYITLPLLPLPQGASCCHCCCEVHPICIVIDARHVLVLLPPQGTSWCCCHCRCCEAHRTAVRYIPPLPLPL